MTTQSILRTHLIFHHGLEDSDYINKESEKLRGGEHCIILSTEPLSLRVPGMPKDKDALQDEYGITFDLFKLTIINTKPIRSSNHLFVKIKNAIESYNDNFGRGIELIIDLTRASAFEAFTCSKISSLYPTTVIDNESKSIIEPMPPHVELNEREQNLLLFFYDHRKLFSKKEVLDNIDDYNANKYQMSKEKFERTKLIRLVLPPLDRDYSVGKNPDYFMVTFSGYYNALINKRCEALQEEIRSMPPVRYREERYEHLMQPENPYAEYGEIYLDNITNPYNDFSN